jgi:hypothetical protein
MKLLPCRDVIIAVFLIAVFACVGCGGMTPGPHKDFWDQCIEFEGYGISALTQYGPVNFGKLTWKRNVACDAKAGS